MSVVNIFTYADSVSSLIWASSLSSAVLLVMLLLQRILSLQEFMDVSYSCEAELLQFLVLLL
jgi:hypothetical protein